jgi:hypothetical protein
LLLDNGLLPLLLALRLLERKYFSLVGRNGIGGKSVLNTVWTA